MHYVSNFSYLWSILSGSALPDWFWARPCDFIRECSRCDGAPVLSLDLKKYCSIPLPLLEPQCSQVNEPRLACCRRSDCEEGSGEALGHQMCHLSHPRPACSQPAPKPARQPSPESRADAPNDSWLWGCVRPEEPSSCPQTCEYQ